MVSRQAVAVDLSSGNLYLTLGDAVMVAVFAK
jgi:hypothetical protein